MRRRLAWIVALAFVAAAIWIAVRPAHDPAPVPAADGSRSADASDEGSRDVAERRGRARGRAVDEPVPGASVLRGTVRGDARQPVAGARVTIHALDALGRVVAGAPAFDSAHVLGATATGSDGTFEIACTAACIVVAAKDGCVPDAQVAEPGQDVTLRLLTGRAHAVRVLDEGRRPVAGATVAVLVWPERPPAPAATTDADGRARFIVTDGAQLVVRAPGFATRSESPDEVEDGAEQTIVLGDGGVLAGLVVTSGGRPVGDATVSVSDDAGDRSVRTGPDGAFRFDDLDARTDVPRFAVAERGDLEGGISTPVGRTDVRIVVGQRTTVRGRVTMADGSPVFGARVEIANGSTTDTAGRFEATDVRPGRRVVFASRSWPWDSDAVVTGSALIDVPDGRPLDDVVIVVGPPADRSVLAVRVIDGDGRDADRPFVDAYVGTHRASEQDRLDRSLLWCSVPPGTAVCLVAGLRSGGHAGPSAWADAATAAIGAAPPEPVVLRLGPPGRLVIHLEDEEGREIALGSGTLAFDDPAPRDLPEGGAWSIAPDVPVAFVVNVPGFAERRVRASPPHPPLCELRVRLAPASRVIGRVVDDRGAPARAETVVAVSLPFDGDMAASSATLEADGTFAIESLPGGHATLQIFDPDERYALRLHHEFDVRSGGTTDVGELRLPRWTLVEGVVADESGRGIGAVRLTFEAPDGVEVAKPVTTGTDGRFRVRLPQDASVRMFTMREGFGAACAGISGGGPDTVRIVVRPGGRVRVRRPAVSGAAPTLGARVAGQQWTWLVEPDPNDESLDSWVYDGFPAGRVELTRPTIGGVEQRATVDVVAGRTVDVVFEE